jgi:hypothetical protein
MHLAKIPGDLTRLAQLDQFDAANANLEPPMPESKEAVMNAFGTSLSAPSEYLAALAPDAAERLGGLHSVALRSFRCRAASWCIAFY